MNTNNQFWGCELVYLIQLSQCFLDMLFHIVSFIALSFGRMIDDDDDDDDDDDGAWCLVRGAWCVVRGAWCMVHGAWCMVHGAWCMVMMCCSFLVTENDLLICSHLS